MSIAIKIKHGLRFDSWSKRYDRSILQHLVFDRSHNMFFSELKSFLKKGTRILDVGCGTGKFMFRLYDCNKDLDLHGMDYSKEMIRQARFKLKDEKITFKIGDVEELPYESETFDIITCSNSFHHYPNQKKAVSEMHRVLKDDGKVMIIDGSRDKILGKVIFNITQIAEGDVYHIFRKELKDMLMSVGFSKVTQKLFNPFAPLLFTLGHVNKTKGLNNDTRNKAEE